MNKKRWPFIEKRFVIKRRIEADGNTIIEGKKEFILFRSYILPNLYGLYCGVVYWLYYRPKLFRHQTSPVDK
jgi:hypothetical protein